MSMCDELCAIRVLYRQRVRPEATPACFFVTSANLCFAYGLYIDEFAAVATFGEYHHAVDEGVDGVVLAQTYVEAGMVNCAALALDDIAGFAGLSAEDFHTESLAF